jgi:glycosyltransferase involved in cell wall biosynthesis
MLRKATGAPVGVIVQDFYGMGSRQSGVSGGKAMGGIVTSLEARLLRAANLVGVIDGDFIAQAQSLGVAADRIRLLPNWTHISSPRGTREEARARLGWDDGVFRVVHTGNMGLKQGLENVVAAAQLAADLRLRCSFVLVGDGNQRVTLERLGAGLPTLEVLPPVSSEEYPDLLQAADVLLVNERIEATEMSLPSKITSYMASDRPILAAVPDGVTRRYLARLGRATFTAPGDPHALLGAVRQFMTHGTPSFGRQLNGGLAADVCLGRYEQFVHDLLGLSIVELGVDR